MYIAILIACFNCYSVVLAVKTVTTNHISFQLHIKLVINSDVKHNSRCVAILFACVGE